MLLLSIYNTVVGEKVSILIRSSVYQIIYFIPNHFEYLRFRIKQMGFRVKIGINRNLIDHVRAVSKITFTIAIPTFGREKILLERTLPSLLNQTYQNFEILIVSDGPEYKKQKLLTEVNDSRIRYFWTRRRARYPKHPKEKWMVQGCKPRNLALKKARGQWILWISDDDILEPWCLETFDKFVKDNKEVDIVTANYLLQTDSGWKLINLQNSGINILGRALTGVPAMILNSNLKFRWRRLSHFKKWNRPNDYDLLERMIKAKARLSHTDSQVAKIPFANSDLRLHGSEAAYTEYLLDSGSRIKK